MDASMGDESLSAWMRALIAYVRSGEPDLTNRQMALLMLVYLTPGPHTVRGLAKALGVSKPVVTRALNTLGGLGYLRRERDQDDRRNVFVVRTRDGAEFLEGSNATSAIATGRPSQTGRSSASPPTPTADFALAGPSERPDPRHHAYRRDLADIALAGRVIASHYAAPLPMQVAAESPLRSTPSDDAEVLCKVEAGEPFEMLDNSLGWAWGYAGRDRLVGYVPSGAVKPF
jgi:DNA-binding MarR family transcriptional regulator